MLLRDKVAIVTGGSSGIGRSIVMAMASAGASVCINYRSHPAAAEEEKVEIQRHGGKAIMVQADVSQIDQLEHLVDETVKVLGRLDIMVNNAGIETRTSILDTSEADYEKVMAVNLKSAFFGTQLAAQQMTKQGGGGRIIISRPFMKIGPCRAIHLIASPKEVCAC